MEPALKVFNKMLFLDINYTICAALNYYGLKIVYS